MSRIAALLACCAIVSSQAAAQRRPEVVVERSAASVPEALVSVRGLLSDRRFLRAMESGFPLYMEYQVALRQSRSMFDRTVSEWAWEYVVLYDPVRRVYVVEDPEGTEELAGQADLRNRLGRVYVVQFQPDRPGLYYYKARVNARTLSDADVDEAFAWLRGEDQDSARLRRPGVVTRTARRLLVRFAPLPRISLEARTADFVWR